MKKSFLTVLLALLAICSLMANGGKEIAVQETPVAAPAPVEEKVEETKTLTYADGTVLRMATGYNSKKTGLSFDADTAGSGVELAGVMLATLSRLGLKSRISLTSRSRINIRETAQQTSLSIGQKSSTR